MKTKQELIDLILTVLWHTLLICIAVVVGAFLTGCASSANRIANTSSEQLCYQSFMGRLKPNESSMVDKLLIERGDDCTKYDMALMMEKEKIQIMQQQMYQQNLIMNELIWR